jgi:hypothetical protein
LSTSVCPEGQSNPLDGTDPATLALGPWFARGSPSTCLVLNGSKTDCRFMVERGSHHGSPCNPACPCVGERSPALSRRQAPAGRKTWSSRPTSIPSSRRHILTSQAALGAYVIVLRTSPALSIQSRAGVLSASTLTTADGGSFGVARHDSVPDQFLPGQGPRALIGHVGCTLK